MQIEKIIEEKYPLPNRAGMEEYTLEQVNEKCIEAAHFGYELGEQMAVEFSEWIMVNAFPSEHKIGKWRVNNSTEYHTTSELFELFKLKTGENGSK